MSRRGSQRVWDWPEVPVLVQVGLMRWRAAASPHGAVWGLGDRGFVLVGSGVVKESWGVKMVPSGGCMCC